MTSTSSIRQHIPGNDMDPPESTCSRCTPPFDLWDRRGTPKKWAKNTGNEPKIKMFEMFQTLPSGKHTKSYWKWPFIVSFPIKNGDFP